jgi:hypothetical protein
VQLLVRERYNPEGQDLGITATTLCNPIQQTILKKRHPDRLKVFDVSDLLWSFLGTIGHRALQEQGRDDALVEERFYATVWGNKISGQTDHYCEQIITDYKLTKSYKIMKGDFTDWERQANCYAWLAEQNGWPVKRLRVITFILDWSQATYQKGYPQCPILEIPLPLWPQEQQHTFIHSRVRELLLAEQVPDHDLPECAEAEMWQDHSYSVVKEGGKRAVKCYANETDSLSHNFKSGEKLVKRMTPRKRCLNHCAAEPVCCQHQRLLHEEGGEPCPTELIAA